MEKTEQFKNYGLNRIQYKDIHAALGERLGVCNKMYFMAKQWVMHDVSVL